MTDLKTVSIFVQTPTMKKLLLLFSISALIVSCGSNEECKDCNTKKGYKTRAELELDKFGPAE